ncbi:MAG: ABC transporter substrate-binding protein [Actinobacteria bacterium]|nr:ABC transporter substrate-binding protein [Actinomycetota bacterium]
MAKRYSRRDFLRFSALTAVAAATGCNRSSGPTTNATSASGLSGDLRILQWSHFVPRHDDWFGPFAQEWGESVGVNVTVDHISLAELPPRAASEISAGQGHDLIELLSPPANLEPSVLDLTDINEEAQRRHGEQVGLCTRSSLNPTTNKFYGFCHGWVPDPGNYRRSLWEQVDMPDGPATYEDLLTGGGQILSELSVALGLGMSNEIDSNMAARAMIWSFGGSIQDENENVVLNSPETVEAVSFMKQLFDSAMTNEVFGWDAASNNQGLIAGELSYILNSISAYRSAQTANPEVADDVFFTRPLEGPGGTGLASEHVIPIYVVPEHAENPEAAKEFMLHLVGNYDQATDNSELYTFPAFPSTVPNLDEWLDDDPYESNPADKLALLKDADQWSTNVGHPGPASAAIGEVFGTFVIPQMMAKAARGDLTPQEAVSEAEAQVRTIFDQWRDRGLVGGDS